MMGCRTGSQDRLFYSFNLDEHIPQNHLLPGIEPGLDLSELRQHLADYYSHTGRPSIDPELMIRMLIVGYCYGIRSERRLCEEVHLNLAYRWFCRLVLEDAVPDHPTFSKNRHGRFRASGAFRWVFDEVVRRCMAAGLLNDTAHGVILDVEATPAHRTAEVESTKVMVDRVEARFDITPQRLIGDTAYRTAPVLGWMVNDKGIEPHTPVWDKTERKDDTFSSTDFESNEEANECRCPARHALRQLAPIQEPAPPCHEGRHHHLSVKPARLPGLPDEAPVLPEYAVSQDPPQHPESCT